MWGPWQAAARPGRVTSASWVKPRLPQLAIGAVHAALSGLAAPDAIFVGGEERHYGAVPAIGVQSFRWSLENEQWQGRAKTIRAAQKEGYQQEVRNAVE